MSPEVLAALLEWYRRTLKREAIWGNKATETGVTLLPAMRKCPPVLIEYVLQRLGPDALVLTKKGWGFPEDRMSAIFDEAHAVANAMGNAGVDGQRNGGEAEAAAGTRAGAEGSKTDPKPDAQTEPAPAAPKVLPLLRKSGFVRWKLCDPAAVEEQLKQVPDSQRERKAVLEALKASPERYLPRTMPKHIQTVLKLREDFPNFGEVIEVLADGMSLRARTKAPLQLPPTLMMGAPGLGKTVFSKELAKRLGFHLCVRSLAEMTAGFVLTGGASSWSQSKPGLIAMMLAGMPDDRAPLLMLDELDKARSESSFPPDVVLLGLLEGHTARAFREENLDVSLNLEPMSYLLTGNRLNTVRPEILSRLQRADIRMPTPEEMKRVVASVDMILRQEMHGLAESFEPLSDEVMGCLSVMPPRALRAVLQRAYAKVARRDFQMGGKLVLTAAELEVEANRESSAEAQSRTAPRFVVPLLFIDTEAWWRVH